MNNKVRKTKKWEDPITGEKKFFNITAMIPTDMPNELAFGVNVKVMQEYAMERELEYVMHDATINAITKYAVENNYISDISLDEFSLINDISYKSGRIMHIINGLCSVYKNPVIETNTSVGYLITQSTQYISHSDNSQFKLGTIKTNQIDINGNDVEVDAQIYINPYTSFDKTEILIFEKDNPKKCCIVKLNNLIL